MSVNRDGTVLFFTPKGRMLVDAPKRVERAEARKRRGWADSAEQRSNPDLPPVPSVRPGAPSTRELTKLPNGAALYRDADIPWEIEAAAREAVEESLG